MANSGQLEEEQAAYTPIDTVAPDWIKHWSFQIADTSFSQCALMSDSFGEMLRQFDRVFSRQQQLPVYRFSYGIAFDRMADVVALLAWSPLATPVEASLDVVPEVEPDQAEAPTAELIGHIVDWLKITYDELAGMTGISRSALFYWRKTGATPRIGNVRQVLRLYAVTSLLVRRFGKEGARRWLQSDGIVAWRALHAGDIEGAEDVVRARLFAGDSGNARPGRAANEEADFSAGLGAGGQLRRSARRPTKGRPSQRD